MADTERMTLVEFQVALDNRYGNYDPELRAKVLEWWEKWVEEHVSPPLRDVAKTIAIWERYDYVSPAMRYYRAHYGSELKFE